jgi:hypothetical protein
MITRKEVVTACPLYCPKSSFEGTEGNHINLSGWLISEVNS